MNKHRNEQFWVDSLIKAEAEQIKLAKKIDKLEKDLDCKVDNPQGYRFDCGIAMVHVCFRNQVIKAPYRRTIFGKLTKLRRRLQMLQSTKIPYYKLLIESGNLGDYLYKQSKG